MSDVGVAVVVEDDADVCNLLETVLVAAGFEVHTAQDGREGVELVRDRQPSVVTLDVGMPGIDGFEALRRIRQFSDAYVLKLTGRTTEAHVLMALQAGADDYVTGNAEAVLVPTPANGDRPREETVLRHNGLALGYSMRTVAVAGAPMELTRSEFDLLHELLRTAGAVRSRRQLVATLRGGCDDGSGYISEAAERTVEVHIGNLRRKLGDDQLRPRWLQTVRSVGYRLARERQDDAD